MRYFQSAHRLSALVVDDMMTRQPFMCQQEVAQWRDRCVGWRRFSEKPVPLEKHRHACALGGAGTNIQALLDVVIASHSRPV